MPRYKWVRYSGEHETLPGMVHAGRDRDGAALVVGRVEHAGEVLPAEAKPEHGVAYVAHGGREHEKRVFEILMATDVQWIGSRDGEIPNGAVEAGVTNTGETLYVGRGNHEGTPTVGKVHPSHGCLYVPYGGKEVALEKYDILMQM